MRLTKKQYGNLLTSTIFLVIIGLAGLTGCSSGVKRPPIDIPAVAPQPTPMKKINVALVLGAGGSRGLAHLGVLEVLEKEGIPIDLIVGSSAGSLVGALYCDNPDSLAVKNKLINLKKEDLLDPSLSALLLSPVQLTCPVQGNALEQFIVQQVKAQDFTELKIPLVAVATNVNNNHITMLRSGPIAPAVHASSALPPIFTPVHLYQQTLVDGAVIAPVPVQVAKLFKPKMIIAVDISTPPSRIPLQNAVDLAFRAIHISFYELSRMQSSRAEVTIHPDLSGFGTFDDNSNEEIYDKGKAATQAAIKDIKKILKLKGIKRKIVQPNPAVANTTDVG